MSNVLQHCIANLSFKKESGIFTIATFKKMYNQDITQHQYSVYSLTLIRLIIKTAKELYAIKLKSNFRLKLFENTALLNQIICKQISLQDYCKEKYLTHQEVLQIIRKEFVIIANLEKVNVVSADSEISTENVPA